MLVYEHFDATFHIYVVLSFKHLKILIFDMYSKLCRDILKGLCDLAKREEDIAKLGTFRETFNINSVVISKGRAKLANMRVAGNGTSIGGGGTCVGDDGRVSSGGRVDGGGGPSTSSGGNDNSNFKSMIEGIFTGKAKPYLLELFMDFMEDDTKSER